VVRVFTVAFAIRVATVVLVELFGSVGTFEFVAFAGGSGKGDGHQQQGKKFHRAAS
jgi:hypothetical protein